MTFISFSETPNSYIYDVDIEAPGPSERAGVVHPSDPHVGVAQVHQRFASWSRNLRSQGGSSRRREQIIVFMTAWSVLVDEPLDDHADSLRMSCCGARGWQEYYDCVQWLLEWQDMIPAPPGGVFAWKMKELIRRVHLLQQYSVAMKTVSLPPLPPEALWSTTGSQLDAYVACLSNLAEGTKIMHWNRNVLLRSLNQDRSSEVARG